MAAGTQRQPFRDQQQQNGDALPPPSSEDDEQSTRLAPEGWVKKARGGAGSTTSSDAGIASLTTKALLTTTLSEAAAYSEIVKRERWDADAGSGGAPTGKAGFLVASPLPPPPPPPPPPRKSHSKSPGRRGRLKSPGRRSGLLKSPGRRGERASSVLEDIGVAGEQGAKPDAKAKRRSKPKPDQPAIWGDGGQDNGGVRWDVRPEAPFADRALGEDAEAVVDFGGFGETALWGESGGAAAADVLTPSSFAEDLTPWTGRGSPDDGFPGDGFMSKHEGLIVDDGDINDLYGTGDNDINGGLAVSPEWDKSIASAFNFTPMLKSGAGGDQRSSMPPALISTRKKTHQLPPSAVQSAQSAVSSAPLTASSGKVERMKAAAWALYGGDRGVVAESPEEEGQGPLSASFFQSSSTAADPEPAISQSQLLPQPGTSDDKLASMPLTLNTSAPEPVNVDIGLDMSNGENPTSPLTASLAENSNSIAENSTFSSSRDVTAKSGGGKSGKSSKKGFVMKLIKFAGGSSKSKKRLSNAGTSGAAASATAAVKRGRQRQPASASASALASGQSRAVDRTSDHKVRRRVLSRSPSLKSVRGNGGAGNRDRPVPHPRSRSENVLSHTPPQATPLDPPRSSGERQDTVFDGNSTGGDFTATTAPLLPPPPPPPLVVHSSHQSMMHETTADINLNPPTRLSVDVADRKEEKNNGDGASNRVDGSYSFSQLHQRDDSALRSNQCGADRDKNDLYNEVTVTSTPSLSTGSVVLDKLKMDAASGNKSSIYSDDDLDSEVSSGSSSENDEMSEMTDPTCFRSNSDKVEGNGRTLPDDEGGTSKMKDIGANLTIKLMGEVVCTEASTPVAKGRGQSRTPQGGGGADELEDRLSGRNKMVRSSPETQASPLSERAQHAIGRQARRTARDAAGAIKADVDLSSSSWTSLKSHEQEKCKSVLSEEFTPRAMSPFSRFRQRGQRRDGNEVFQQTSDPFPSAPYPSEDPMPKSPPRRFMRRAPPPSSADRGQAQTFIEREVLDHVQVPAPSEGTEDKRDNDNAPHQRAVSLTPFALRQGRTLSRHSDSNRTRSRAGASASPRPVAKAGGKTRIELGADSGGVTSVGVNGSRGGTKIPVTAPTPPSDGAKNMLDPPILAIRKKKTSASVSSKITHMEPLGQSRETVGTEGQTVEEKSENVSSPYKFTVYQSPFRSLKGTMDRLDDCSVGSTTQESMKPSTKKNDETMIFRDGTTATVMTEDDWSAPTLGVSLAIETRENGPEDGQSDAAADEPCDSGISHLGGPPSIKKSEECPEPSFSTVERREHDKSSYMSTVHWSPFKSHAARLLASDVNTGSIDARMSVKIKEDTKLEHSGEDEKMLVLKSGEERDCSNKKNGVVIASVNSTLDVSAECEESSKEASVSREMEEAISMAEPIQQGQVPVAKGRRAKEESYRPAVQMTPFMLRMQARKLSAKTVGPKGVEVRKTQTQVEMMAEPYKPMVPLMTKILGKKIPPEAGITWEREVHYNDQPKLSILVAAASAEGRSESAHMKEPVKETSVFNSAQKEEDQDLATQGLNRPMVPFSLLMRIDAKEQEGEVDRMAPSSVDCENNGTYVLPRMNEVAVKTERGAVRKISERQVSTPYGRLPDLSNTDKVDTGALYSNLSAVGSIEVVDLDVSNEINLLSPRTARRIRRNESKTKSIGHSAPTPENRQPRWEKVMTSQDDGKSIANRVGGEGSRGRTTTRNMQSQKSDILDDNTQQVSMPSTLSNMSLSTKSSRQDLHFNFDSGLASSKLKGPKETSESKSSVPSTRTRVKEYVADSTHKDSTGSSSKLDSDQVPSPVAVRRTLSSRKKAQNEAPIRHAILNSSHALRLPSPSPRSGYQTLSYRKTAAALNRTADVMTDPYSSNVKPKSMMMSTYDPVSGFAMYFCDLCVLVIVGCHLTFRCSTCTAIMNENLHGRMILTWTPSTGLVFVYFH